MKDDGMNETIGGWMFRGWEKVQRQRWKEDV